MTPVDGLALAAMWTWALWARTTRSARTVGVLVAATLAWFAVAQLPPGVGIFGRSVVAFVVLYAFLLHPDAFSRLPAKERRFGNDYSALLTEAGELAQRQKGREITIPDLISGLERVISDLENLEPPTNAWSELRRDTAEHLRSQVRRFEGLTSGKTISDAEHNAVRAEVDRLRARFAALMDK